MKIPEENISKTRQEVEKEVIQELSDYNEVNNIKMSEERFWATVDFLTDLKMGIEPTGILW